MRTDIQCVRDLTADADPRNPASLACGRCATLSIICTPPVDRFLAIGTYVR